VGNRGPDTKAHRRRETGNPRATTGTRVNKNGPTAEESVPLTNLLEDRRNSERREKGLEAGRSRPNEIGAVGEGKTESATEDNACFVGTKRQRLETSRSRK